MSTPNSTTVSAVIDAPPDAVYRAYLDPHAVAIWLPPGNMIGVVHAFDARESGAFSMSLVYPEGENTGTGKSSANADTFNGRMVELVSNEKIVWAVEFESNDSSYSGEMLVTTTLAPIAGGTEVTFIYENIPPGIHPEDNEAGCRSTLEKLAKFLGG